MRFAGITALRAVSGMTSGETYSPIALINATNADFS